jgi:hypothetical protein
VLPGPVLPQHTHKRCDKKVAHHQNFTNSTTDNIRLVEIGCEMLTRGRNNSGSLAMFATILRAYAEQRNQKMAESIAAREQNRIVLL